LYAGTNQGVYYRQGGASWLALGNAYDVRALAVGAQALYTGRNADASVSGALVVQPLIGSTAFTPIESMPTVPATFSVRALLVAAGSVYAAGGVRQSADPADPSVYDNSVYVASDFVPATPLVAPTWRGVGSGSFSGSAILSQLAVGAGQVFAGGDGFLYQCSGATGCGWGSIALPITSALEPENVSALASDGTTLYVGTSSHGLLAMTLNSITGLVAVSGSGATALPSATVNGVRLLAGSLYVATAAGLATPVAVAVTPGGGGGGSGGGGGCSMANAGEPDPLLWLLVGLAALQIVIARRRRAKSVELAIAVRRKTLEDRQ
jgi:hypothetical protein